MLKSVSNNRKNAGGVRRMAPANSARSGLRNRYSRRTFDTSKNNSFMIVSTETNVNYQRIEQAIKYLEENFQRQPELDEVADKVHLSPFHFQRIFTDWAGISPKRFLQFLTVGFLKSKLQESKNIVEAADSAGLSSQSRVYDLFTTLEAVTPQEYKLKGSGIQVEYGFHETPFGTGLIGITERGICWLSFLNTEDGPQAEMEKMKEHWHNSVFHQNQELTGVFTQQIFGEQPLNGKKLHLLVKGTNFQVKVWEALLRLPMGSVTTYQGIAEQIHNPKAMQAVGSAVGSNHIAYLIPCHRVIRKDGILGEYRWSAARKKSIIGWEMAKAS
jgi:AraC family transcriptional regulator of adaptative response/methylated-DNA-[protein]-cysteine methyltransferase